MYNQSTVQAITGSNVTIQCGVIPSAFSNFVIKWYLTWNMTPDNCSNINTLDRHDELILGENDYELKLTNVNQSNIGKYYCSASASLDSNQLAYSKEYSCIIGHITELQVGKQDKLVMIILVQSRASFTLTKL